MGVFSSKNKTSRLSQKAWIFKSLIAKFDAHKTLRNSTAIQDSNPSAMVLCFPDDLIHEVLLRLPAKSLLKFKCVSKPWFSLISSNQFIKAHLNFNTSIANQRLLIMCRDANIIGGQGYFKHYSLKTLLDGGLEESVETIKLRLLSEYISCCNGLALIVIKETFMYLWNPCIRKVKKLPDLGVCPSGDYYRIANGFGYDKVNNDYKVVVVIGMWPDVESWPEVMVYSTKTESWRKIGCFPGFWPVTDGEFVDGKLYWQSIPIKSSGRRTIEFLDLATETYGRVEEPRIDDHRPTLGTFGGNLSLCWTYGNADTEVWVMKEDGVKKSWIKVLRIPRKVCWFSALSKSANDEVLVLINGKIGLCNPKDCSVRYIKGCADNSIFYASCFIESLVNPMSLMSDSAQ